jgi:hypothetical protein
MYKNVALASTSLDQNNLLSTAFTSVVGLTAATFVGYTAFLYEPDKSVLSGCREVGLFMALGGVIAAQTVAIKKLEAVPFFAAFVMTNALIQLTELPLYDTIKNATPYQEHAASVGMMTAVGMGSLKISSQIVGKRMAAGDSRSEHSHQPFLTWGICAVAFGLGIVEAGRDYATTNQSLHNGSLTAALSMGMFGGSVFQTLGIKLLRQSHYPYAAVVSQCVSTSVGFALNIQLTKGAALFDTEKLDLYYRAAFVASLNIAGCMVGRDLASFAFPESREKTAAPTEKTPLLSEV